MADAMDWHPTTPQTCQSPYPVNYIPGGWLATPPTPRFSKRESSSDVQPAAKRACAGLTQALRATTQLVTSAFTQPLYQIVREVRLHQSTRRGLRQQINLSKPSQTVQSSPGNRAVTQPDQSEVGPTAVEGDLSYPENERREGQARDIAPFASATLFRGPQVEQKKSGVQSSLFPSTDRQQTRSHQTTKLGPRLALQKDLPLPDPFLGTPVPAAGKVRGATMKAMSVSHRWPSRRGHGTQVAPFPELYPTHEAKSRLSLTPPASPSAQVLADLKISASSDNESDASSTFSDTWQPLKSRTGKQIMASTPPEHRLPAARDQKSTCCNTDGNTASPTPATKVDQLPDSVDRQAAETGLKLLTPPPIKMRRTPLPVPAESAAQSGRNLRPATSSVIPLPPETPESEISSLCEVSPNAFSFVADLQSIADNTEGKSPETPDKDSTTSTKRINHDDPALANLTTESISTQTPEQILAKLTLQDVYTPEQSTPKASLHSAEKLQRLTRTERKRLERQKESFQYEISALSEEWEARVAKAVAQGHGKLSASDFARVAPVGKGRSTENWLNDEVINAYLNLITAHGKQNDRPDQVPTYHAFNSFFFTNLSTKGADSVKRWAARAKIGGKSLLEMEKVFIPINSGAHWTLCVVAPKARKIIHYNSMRGDGTRYVRLVQEWVRAELGRSWNEDEWTLEARGESPQQTNMDDCGVFTITSARQLMLGFTPMTYKSGQIQLQRRRIVAELVNGALLKSS